MGTVTGGGYVAGKARSLSAGTLTRDVWASLRPKQWAKNVMVFGPLVFSVNEYWSPADPSATYDLLLRALFAFVLFCWLSSAQYLVNDVLDVARDREHPQKRQRPIAAGRVSPQVAVGWSVALTAAALAGSLAISPGFAVAAALYALLCFGYSFSFKHVLIVDVFAIALGFVLRAAAGAVAIGVPISPWLYVCTGLGALFLALTKRRHELELLGTRAGSHRTALDGYSLPLLDQMISVVTSSTVLAYSVYTFTAESLPRNHVMMATIPFVLYGIFRYLYLVHARNQGGAPEDALFADIPLVIDILAWIAVSGLLLILYRNA